MTRTIHAAAVLAFAAALAGGAAGASAAVLDMEGVAPSGSTTTENNANFAMSGFNLFVTHGHFISATDAAVGVTLTDNGSDWLVVDTVNPITVSKIGGGAFSIQSFDATFYRLDRNGDAARNHVIEAVGALSGGGSIAASFTIDDLDPFQTFAFGAGWTDVLSVSFTNPTIDPNFGPFGSNMAFDNFVVDQEIAEPAALGLFGLGLAGLGLATRRRRAA